MADMPRARQMEYYNPRPLILGMCFFWGVVMGFCLFYFSPPQIVETPSAGDGPAAIVPPPSVSAERVRPPTENIEDVVIPQRPNFTNTEFPLPAFPLSTDRALNGQTAIALRQGSVQRPPAVPPPVSSDLRDAPIPDFLP